MKLTLSLFNKTQVITTFIPEALTIAELFGCVLEMAVDVPAQALPAGLDLWPLKVGPMMELEMHIQGDGALEALFAIRHRMLQCFCEADHQLN